MYVISNTDILFVWWLQRWNQSGHSHFLAHTTLKVSINRVLYYYYFCFLKCRDKLHCATCYTVPRASVYCVWFNVCPDTEWKQILLKCIDRYSKLATKPQFFTLTTCVASVPQFPSSTQILQLIMLQFRKNRKTTKKHPYKKVMLNIISIATY